MIKIRTLRWFEHVTSMEEKRNAHKNHFVNLGTEGRIILNWILGGMEEGRLNFSGCEYGQCGSLVNKTTSLFFPANCG
jgi:hypothetical protein